MTFKAPWVLFFLPAVLFALAIHFRRIRPPAFRFPSREMAVGMRPTWRIRLCRLPEILRFATVVLFMVALAGPRTPQGDGPRRAQGINIMLLVDVSTSMAAEDFTVNGKRTNRLEVVKGVVRRFVEGRPQDRIGLVAFAARPYLVCPLTLDHAWLIENLERFRFGIIDDGTAVGSGIASAVSRFRDAGPGAQVAVLLTDGANNAGQIDPRDAARLARTRGVRVYTVGAGSRGPVPYPTVDLFGRKVYQQVSIDLDENMLGDVARITGGAYFRATDTASLEDIYARIDRMEKTTFEESRQEMWEELFAPVLLAGLALLVFEAMLARTVFMRVP